jgi:single-stranded-DNA-specific exonuclease
MLESKKIWRLLFIPDQESVENLSKSINLNPTLSSILIQRGIKSFDAARSYFRPSLDELNNPFLMKDMDKAAARIVAALQLNEKIQVYGDYDVDGTTSVAMMVNFLRKYSDNITHYVPDRFTEGYGVSSKGIHKASNDGVHLIISLDCGIKSADPVALAVSLGMDFIICDHHQAGEVLPIATAVLDPKRLDCEYPYKELSGCGVGFKLIQAICILMGLPKEEAFEYLDLLAVSIASDIVPITGENRILAFHGLKKLNESPQHGLKALSGSAGLKKELTISNVVFGIGPRINASGRVAHASQSIELLLSENEVQAEKLSQGLNKKNTDRRELDLGITAEAIDMIQSSDSYPYNKSNVLYNPDWHKGVVGIVASRCIEFHHRPTIILTESEGKATGSARSIRGLDLYACISACSDLLIQYGGHTHAAGMTLKIENVPLLAKRFEEEVSKYITDDMLYPTIEIDAELDLNQITIKFYRTLEQFGPFGPGNMQPVFISKNVQIDNNKIWLLKEEHLKLRVKQTDSLALDAIGFGLGHLFETVKNARKLQICYSIGENEFNGIKSLQLFLKDIRPED